jgi:hypothetical protein
MASRFQLIVAAALTLSACGGLEPDPTIPPDKTPEPWVNEKPQLLVASPGEMAVGDSLTILGQKLIKPTNGKIMLHFRGNYFDDAGAATPVDFDANPAVTLDSNGVVKNVSWQLWPNIVFDRTGDHLGRFVGLVVALNMGNDGSQQFSDPLPLTINVQPSILPRIARPANSSCSSVVSDTLEGQGMAFTAEVVGLRAGTSDNPLTFHWSFLGEQWKVAVNYGTMDPSSVVPKTGAFVLQDNVTSGRTSVVSDGGNRMFLLKIGSDLLGDSRLKELKTGTIAAEGNNMPITVNVAAVDSSGKSAKLTIKLVIHRQAEMTYDGAMTVAERFPAVLVSDCIPGGDIGRDVTYHEGSSESRARSLGFSWNTSLGGSIAPIPSNPFALGINFSLGFGMNVSENVSTDKSKSLSIQGHILPGQYGVFYRQTTKLHRKASLVGFTQCGQSFQLGQVILTDWMFTPDLATGRACTPPTKLQPAQKFE